MDNQLELEESGQHVIAYIYVLWASQYDENNLKLTIQCDKKKKVETWNHSKKRRCFEKLYINKMKEIFT